ncbi:hypothetical protein KDA_74590 [Dictyobacter alpinus]|uniref:DNA polymerase III beta sliding clamp C-terminal domain-containing protein n=1 Tax=Dictyobacter alpinus TaxID=2014873 RepID=A0A402BKU1_9CHLR|nr:DNA polymerase III subunit beta [Dictyobacter alpinus]GCE31975.1 hypothetical protein KDA_74590 [Dictyobacter alpinus]
MQFTVDAHALLHALKSINIRYHMHAFVQIQAQDGRLTLRTCTEPPFRWSRLETPSVVASVSITESLTIPEEGQHAAQYQALVNAVKMFDGSIALRREEQAVIVERPGDLTQQTPVEGTSISPDTTVVTSLFSEGTVHPEVGATYTRKESQWGNCPTCGRSEHKEQVNLYRLAAVMTQQARVGRDQLFSMFKQVAWAVASEDDYGNGDQGRTGVYLSLKDEVLLLQARDGHCLAQRWAELPGAEDWEHAVIIPARPLERALQLFPKKSDILLEAVLLQHQHVKKDEEDILDAEPFMRAREIRLSSGDMRVSIGLLNGDIPDYRSFFARVRETQVVCATADLLNACKAVSTVAEARSTVMWLHVNEAGISIEAGHDDQSLQRALHQVQAVASMSENISFATGWGCLPDALKAITAPQVTIEMSGPEDPIVLRPTGGSDDYRCAVTAAKA